MISHIVADRVTDGVGLFSLEAGHETVTRVTDFRLPIVAHVLGGRVMDEYVAGASGEDIAAALHPL